MNNLPSIVFVALLAAVAASAHASTKSEHFDNDPGWEGFQNRIQPKAIKKVEQNFGYSATHFAGKEEGEIGGKVWRSSTPASYADRTPSRSLKDRLSASGTFVITASSG